MIVWGVNRENRSDPRIDFRSSGGIAASIAFAGAAVWMSGLAQSLEKGMEMAEEAATSGAALARLDQFVEVTNRLSPSGADA